MFVPARGQVWRERNYGYASTYTVYALLGATGRKDFGAEFVDEEVALWLNGRDQIIGWL